MGAPLGYRHADAGSRRSVLSHLSRISGRSQSGQEELGGAKGGSDPARDPAGSSNQHEGPAGATEERALGRCDDLGRFNL